jgi:hypothetical protein
MGTEKEKFNERVQQSEPLEGKSFRVLKDDGCNTDVMSYEFFKRYKKLLRWKSCEVEVRHSKSGLSENSSTVVLGATLNIRNHKYISNWLVADCRYDLLLGMPWHVSNNPVVNYQKRFIKIGNGIINVPREKRKLSTEAMNMSVNEFRRLVNQKRNDPEVQIFKAVPNYDLSDEKDASKKSLLDCSHKGLRNVLQRFESVFQSELPSGLPPEREVDHEIETEKDAKPPHRSLYQLSPVELNATKKYVEDLMKKRKIRPSKSPYGAPDTPT